MSVHVISILSHNLLKPECCCGVIKFHGVSASIGYEYETVKVITTKIFVTAM